MTDTPSDTNLEQFLTEFEEQLFNISERLYAARREFLRDGFEGYPADTIYVQSEDAYMYWPQQDDGWFIGYDEPCPEEQELIDEFERATGFDYIGCGNARLVFETPEPYEYAVKIGRCGTDLNFGHGRRHVISEREYTRQYADDAPLLPCLHASSGGEFGVYPLVEADMRDRPPEDDAVIERLRDAYAAAIPEYDRDHVTEDPMNFGWWDGEPVVIDYFHAHRNRPMGVPDHVDGEWVIEEVNRLRRQGKKQDLAESGGELVDPPVLE